MTVNKFLMLFSVFTTTFGQGGFRTVHRGGARHAQGGQNQPTEPRSVFAQLAPLFILFAITLLSNLPSLFETSAPPDPVYSFAPSARYNVPQFTGDLGIQYHINPSEVMKHPVIGPELIREGYDLNKKDATTGKPPQILRGKGQPRTPALSKFEKSVETRYTNQLYAHCQKEISRIERARENEYGIFGIGIDYEKLKALEAEAKAVPSCNELRQLGIIR